MRRRRQRMSAGGADINCARSAPRNVGAAEQLALIPRRLIRKNANCTHNRTTVAHRNCTLLQLGIPDIPDSGIGQRPLYAQDWSGSASSAILHQIGMARKPPLTRVSRRPNFRSSVLGLHWRMERRYTGARRGQHRHPSRSVNSEGLRGRWTRARPPAGPWTANPGC